MPVRVNVIERSEIGKIREAFVKLAVSAKGSIDG
jgi:hypothetical protein